MRVLLWIAAFAVASFALPAFAQFVTVEQARDTAFGVGVDLIDKIELDDGVWEVKGHDNFGHKIKLEIDAASGEVVKIKRR
ncbi:MAG TPA: PepSY domain-containing protein [Methyloceanibacter sp.]|jgi:uncharacterized membrane protein YkoI